MFKLNMLNLWVALWILDGDGSCLLQFAERLRIWQRTVASVFNRVSRSPVWAEDIHSEGWLEPVAKAFTDAQENPTLSMIEAGLAVNF